MRDKVEKVSREAVGQDASRRPRLDKGKEKVEKVLKKMQHLSASGVSGFTTSSPQPRFEAHVGEKLMATSITSAMRPRRGPVVIDPP